MICFLLFIFFYVGLNNKKEHKSVTDFSMFCGPKTVRHGKKWGAQNIVKAVHGKHKSR